MKYYCKRCHGKIQKKTAEKYQGYSRQCLAKINLKKKSSPKIKKELLVSPSLIDLEIQNELKMKELEKEAHEQRLLETILQPKENNKAKVIEVLNSLSLNLLGMSLLEVVA